jgi:hypothetical protein
MTNLPRPECFGTGLMESGQPQRPERCDICPEVRGCLIRINLMRISATMESPTAALRFVPPYIRTRRG